MKNDVPIVQTESKLYTGDTNNVVTATTQVPLVATESRKVNVDPEDGSSTFIGGEIVSSQTISSKTRTVETVTVRICAMKWKILNLYEKNCNLSLMYFFF